MTDGAEISVPSPLPLRIDKNLRRALLKALEKLDEEDTAESRESRESQDENADEILDTSTNRNDEDDDIPNFEQLPINVKEIDDDEELDENVFIDTVKADINKKEDDSPTKISVTGVRNEIAGVDKDKGKTSEVKEVAATPIVSTTKGKLFTIKHEETTTKSARTQRILNSNNIANLLVASTEKTTLSSPTPTHSTPVENGESNVKVEDVQFISAPLVAAFTVQQDEKGLPHKVIPLFGNKLQEKKPQPIKQQNFRDVQSLEEKQRALQQQILYLQVQRKQEELLLKQQEELKKQSSKVNFQEQQLPLRQNSLSFTTDMKKVEEEKKSQVTTQQLPLQQQFSFTSGNVIQESPSHVLNQQLPLRQNSFSFNTDLKNVEQQKKSQVTTQQLPLQQQFSFTSGKIVPDNSPRILSQQLPFEHRTIPFNSIQSAKSSSNVQIHPSVSFQPHSFTQGIIPLSPSFSELTFAGQQPPIKEAVRFQQPPIPFFNRQNAFSQQQIPLQFSFNDNFVQDSLRVQLPPLPPSPQSNRVFRQESQTSNFGFNQNRFNQNFGSNVQTVKSVSLTRPFVETQQHLFKAPNQLSIDDRLKSLFYQSGFGQGRTQEDFNIVSKVLALDHTR